MVYFKGMWEARPTVGFRGGKATVADACCREQIESEIEGVSVQMSVGPDRRRSDRSAVVSVVLLLSKAKERRFLRTRRR